MFTETQNHRHTGADAPRINPKDLMGFPIYKSDSALTHNALAGTVALRWDTTDDSYYLTAFINGGWREIELS
jgi:hypothetical protein